MMKTSQYTENRAERVALFPGSFDPFSLGHYNIVCRGLELFDRVIVGIGINPQKEPMMSVETRKQWIEKIFETNPRVSVVSYEGYTVEAARVHGARFLLRGVRTTVDFEYEQRLALANRDLAGIETVLINTLPQLAHISATLIRERLMQGTEVASLLPPGAPIHLLPQFHTEIF